MPIIRHSYTTISAEQKAPLKGQFKINSGITFVDLKEDSNVTGDSGQGFTIVYDFTTKYGETSAQDQRPRRGLLRSSNRRSQTDHRAVERQEASCPEKTVLQVGNYCLMKAQMKAIELANDLNLQSPVQLPKFEAKK
jgi:D-serine deaminase-like pyridoxal phosphate-dependent protein